MPARLGTPLILHVEDNQAQSDALRRILERNGFAVLHASTADEALHMCRETPVSLVLADHMLSSGRGTEFAGQIKSLKPTVPIVLHSGTLPSTMRHVDAFIHKGDSVPYLVAFIRDLINRSWE